MQQWLQNISFDEINSPACSTQGVRLTVARLDKIHPEVSGNKIFKLHYFIEACIHSAHKTLLTFGGAYSNHLLATAFYCAEKQLKCIGIVRGEQPAQLSHTLTRCQQLGMQLIFVSREVYKKFASNQPNDVTIQNQFGPCTIVPEGGYGPMGAKGAALIIPFLSGEKYSHICTCVGTATTLAGLLLKAEKQQQIIAVPAIKNMTDIYERLLVLGVPTNTTPIIFDDYHFRGYAKYTPELIEFMNNFYQQYQVPTDFVYTGKMMFGIMQKIEKGYFAKGNNIVCLHTGGLQGNQSLPNGDIIF